MKNILKIIIPFVFIITLFISCGEESDLTPYVETVPLTNAKLKLNHTAVGPLGTNYTVNWYLNDVKTSGVLVTTGLPLGINYGGQYPAAINYAIVPAGTLSMKVEIPATTTVAASTVFTSPITLESNKNYSSFVVGYPTYSAFNVVDDLTVATDPTKTYIRFFNLISNAPAAGYDFSIKELNTNAVIYSGVTYLGGSQVFIPVVPVADNLSTTYEFQMRQVGTTTIVAKTTMTPRKGRIYTFYGRGYVGGLSNGNPSTTANIPVLTYYTNK